MHLPGVRPSVRLSVPYRPGHKSNKLCCRGPAGRIYRLIAAVAGRRSCVGTAARRALGRRGNARMLRSGVRASTQIGFELFTSAQIRNKLCRSLNGVNN